MSENVKNINSKPKYVVANLVATYDISPANSQSVSAIDYLCIYEFEYEGKKYKYRTHQRDNFSPIPETLELGFGKDPNKAYKVSHSSNKSDSNQSSILTTVVFTLIFGGGLILAIIFILFFIYYIFDAVVEVKINNILALLFIIFLIIIITRNSLKKQKNGKSRDAMIEEAMLNNRTVTAYLIKERYRLWSNSNSLQNKKYNNEHTYKGTYTYSYNGKKYTKSFSFSSPPPKSMRLFFGKTPKDIIHFTW